ncbi:hypothetical protein N597_06075 [Streptococcus ilei]|nr:hypothetical protein N597_06075 [Streptococcus ilei]
MHAFDLAKLIGIQVQVTHKTNTCHITSVSQVDKKKKVNQHVTNLTIM